MHAGKVWIDGDNVEKGIVETIAQYGIRWLVMGAAADDLYTEYEIYIKFTIYQLSFILVVNTKNSACGGRISNYPWAYAACEIIKV